VITGAILGLWSVATNGQRAGAPARLLTPAVASTSQPGSQQPRPSHHNHCAHNRKPQLIIVSIERQHEWACEGRRTVQSTAVTTGASTHPGDETPRGTFAVQGLNRDTRLHTSNGSYAVKYWIPFHLGVWGFHDASWQRIPYGSPRYVTHGSHGCVHMPLPAIRWLFHWVHYGTPVRIS
jgi:hypothetical protein